MIFEPWLRLNNIDDYEILEVIEIKIEKWMDEWVEIYTHYMIC